MKDFEKREVSWTSLAWRFMSVSVFTKDLAFFATRLAEITATLLEAEFANKETVSL